MEIQMKYSELGSSELLGVIGKIVNTQTSAQKAALIRDWVEKVQEAKNKISEDYKKEVMAVFAQRDEKGQIKTPEGDPNSFIPMEDKHQELIAANEAFGDKTITIDCNPLTFAILSDVKISASEIDLFKGLFVSGGPGVPNMAPVPIRPNMQKELSN